MDEAHGLQSLVPEAREIELLPLNSVNTIRGKTSASGSGHFEAVQGQQGYSRSGSRPKCSANDGREKVGGCNQAIVSRWPGKTFKGGRTS